ncbi:MAG TPA: pyrrolo-quinoline quinone [Verrucomicrobiae bacterium]|nr:pyrrolo-quinoline quinone [Verrucomicrobiae bacterium]
MHKRAVVVVFWITATVLTVFLGEGLQRVLTTPPPSTVQVLTYHNDNARTGQNLEEKILTRANVNAKTFGKLGFLTTDGLVDAEPLYVSNVTVSGHARNAVFVATEHDFVYAFDAETMTQLWRVTMLAPGEIPSDDRRCGQVTPEIGVTATPVIALREGRGVMYVVAMSKDKVGNYFHRLHALDIASGAELPGSPVTVQATFPNLHGVTTFDAKQYKERASLLLLDGIVYTSWASHCDEGDYTGWIIGYHAETLKQTHVLNLTPNGSAGAIWMSGAGPAADSQGNIYILDGNGTFDEKLDSCDMPVNGDFGNAFLKLSVQAGKLRVTDYFNTHDTQAQSGRDEDLGSGGALVLPDLHDDSGRTWQLAVGAGKDRRIYVVDRNDMGKFTHKKNARIYQEIDHMLAGPVFSMPAYFNNTVYFASVNDTMKAFSISNAKLVPTPTSKSSAHFAYPGATPSISANGSADAIVWAVEAHGSEAGILHAYDAGNLANELYSSSGKAHSRDAFSDNKFITPMIANGRVFVGTLTGVAVFGLLPQDKNQPKPPGI